MVEQGNLYNSPEGSPSMEEEHSRDMLQNGGRRREHHNGLLPLLLLLLGFLYPRIPFHGPVVFHLADHGRGGARTGWQRGTSDDDDAVAGKREQEVEVEEEEKRIPGNSLCESLSRPSEEDRIGAILTPSSEGLSLGPWC